MSAFRYSTHVRCACPEGQKCPKLWRRDGSWNSRHGSAGWAARVPTGSGTRLVRKFGFGSTAAAHASARDAGHLLDLAGDDAITRARIGDLIAAARRGQPLPAISDVRRRLALGTDPGSPGVTFGDAWAGWLAGKRRLRRSSRERIGQIGEHWLLPVLAGVPLERLNGGHCAAVFSRIGQINAAITAQQGEDRAYVHVEGDVRERPRLVGIATQHRVYAALREFCNFEVRKTRRLAFNPAYVVELPPEVTPEARRWTAAQARAFLAASADDPLHLLFRIVLLSGPRRGEAAGLRWGGTDLDAGRIRVERPVLLIGAEVTEGTPKTRAGERLIWLDDKTIALLREHRRDQLRARMAAGGQWQDNDLIFCRPDGTPWRPDHVTRRFQAIARQAGLPVIRLHEGRHSAASLAHDAAVDPEIRPRTLGHADAAMTRHYTHPEAAAYRAAAGAVAALVDGP